MTGPVRSVSPRQGHPDTALMGGLGLFLRPGSDLTRLTTCRSAVVVCGANPAGRNLTRCKRPNPPAAHGWWVR